MRKFIVLSLLVLFVCSTLGQQEIANLGDLISKRARQGVETQAQANPSTVKLINRVKRTFPLFPQPQAPSNVMILAPGGFSGGYPYGR